MARSPRPLVVRVEMNLAPYPWFVCGVVRRPLVISQPLASGRLVVANRCEPINVALISSFFGLQPLCIKRQQLLFLKCRIAPFWCKDYAQGTSPLAGLAVAFAPKTECALLGSHKKTGSSEPVFSQGVTGFSNDHHRSHPSRSPRPSVCCRRSHWRCSHGHRQWLRGGGPGSRRWSGRQRTCRAGR